MSEAANRFESDAKRAKPRRSRSEGGAKCSPRSINKDQLHE